MSEKKIISPKAKKYFPLVLGYIPVSFLLFFTAFMFMRFPSVTAQGISDGIDLSLGTLIPTLYPFMILSTLMVEQQVFDHIPKVLKNITPEVKAQILADLVKNVWPKVESGEVKPTIFKVLPIQEAEAAHDILYKGQNIGKVVLEVL